MLVEGAVANEEHLEMIRRVRRDTEVLISFGDCAVTGNVTALRNPLGPAEPVLRRATSRTATSRRGSHTSRASSPCCWTR